MSQNEGNRPNFQGLPLILMILGLILVAGAVIYAISNASAGNGSQAFILATATTNRNIPYPDMKRVTLEEAKAAFDNKSAIFVDVRSVEAYQAAHIPGAINIPLEEMETRASELDQNQRIITYCT